MLRPATARRLRGSWTGISSNLFWPVFERKGEQTIKYVCNVCRWVYDEDEAGVKWEDLPDDFACEVCGVGKDGFSSAVFQVMSNFGDSLRANTKSEEQVAPDFEERSRLAFQRVVQRYVDNLKNLCMLSAKSGKRKITTTEGYHNSDGLEYPFTINDYKYKLDARNYAEAVCTQLRSEGVTADYKLIREYRHFKICFILSW